MTDVRPITEQHSNKMLQLSGIDIYEGKLVELKDLRKSIMVSIHDAEKAKSDEVFWGRAIRVASLVGVASEVALARISHTE